MEKKTGIIRGIVQKRGFGFIRQSDGSDIFFHASSVLSPEFENLREGMAVQYMVVEAPRGFKAIGVTTVSDNNSKED